MLFLDVRGLEECWRCGVVEEEDDEVQCYDAAMLSTRWCSVCLFVGKLLCSMLQKEVNDVKLLLSASNRKGAKNDDLKTRQRRKYGANQTFTRDKDFEQNRFQFEFRNKRWPYDVSFLKKFWASLECYLPYSSSVTV